MSTPTKGPWKWEPEGQFILSSTGDIVAEIPCQGCNPADGPLIADAPALQAENTRLREALRAGKDLVESSVSHVTHGGPTRVQAEAWLELATAALAAGKGETVPTEKCAQCGKQTEETWSCSDGVNESMRVCADCRGER